MSALRDWIAAAFLVAGAGFMLLAAVGVARFPDLFTRMQATTKAGTLGVGSVMIAVAIHFARADVVAHVVVIVLFFCLTLPVGAQRIARAAHRTGVPLWKGTLRDELRQTEAESRLPAADGEVKT